MNQQEHEVLTEINFLRLPIFKASSLQNQVSPETTTLSYEQNGKQYSIEIRYGNLTSFDRKVMLCLEFLYLKQNPNYESNKVKTTNKEISNLLGIGIKNTKLIWESLSKLQDVRIKGHLLIKNE